MITALIIWLFTLPVRIIRGLNRTMRALFIPKPKYKKRGR